MANRMTESYVMVESYIRGYHVYKDAAGWDPQLNEERALKREPKNIKDVNAVAVVRPNLEDCSLKPQPRNTLTQCLDSMRYLVTFL